MKRLIIVLCFLTLTFTLSAQDDSPKYQLREPTLSDYLEVITEFDDIPCYWGVFDRPDTEYWFYPWDLCTTLAEELYEYNAEFPNQNYDLLVAAYHKLALDEPYASRNLSTWNRAIIQAWLREHQPDLETETTLVFDEYTVTVEPRDFSGDGENEYLLYVESYAYTTYLVVDVVEDGAYQIVDTYFDVASGGYAYWDWYSGTHADVFFGDVNDDGLPEWFLAYGNVGGGHRDHGSLGIYAWRDGHLEGIHKTSISYSSPAPGPLVGIDWQLENLDDDSASELLFTKMGHDNWNCVWDDITLYDWQPETRLYSTQGSTREYEISLNCAVRAAEQSMYSGDYLSAFQLYTYALSLPYTDRMSSVSEIFNNELYQYVQLRRAIAALLTEQYTVSQEIIADLQNQEPASELMEVLITQLDSMMQTQESYDPLPGCISVYNVIYDYVADEYFYNLPTELYIGEIVDDPTQPQMNIPPPSPGKAGCDVTPMIDYVAGSAFYPQDHAWDNLSVPEQFKVAGLEVEGFITTDLNNDGVEDWLVWPVARVAPLLLTSAPNTTRYEVSRPEIARPNQYTEVAIVTLPDGVSKAIVRSVNLDFYPMNATGRPYDIASGRCPADDDIDFVTGTLDIWQIEGDELIRTLHMGKCHPSTIEELFPDNQITLELSGWSSGEDSYDWNPVVYHWDTTTQLYRLPDEPSTEITPTPQPITLTAEPTHAADYATIIYDFGEIKDLVQHADIETAIRIFDTQIGLQETIYIQVLLRYQKARVLNEAGLFDEALAEYVAIYEAAPESAWGMLAALHIEEID